MGTHDDSHAYRSMERKQNKLDARSSRFECVYDPQRRTFAKNNPHVPTRVCYLSSTLMYRQSHLGLCRTARVAGRRPSQPQLSTPSPVRSWRTRWTRHTPRPCVARMRWGLRRCTLRSERAQNIKARARVNTQETQKHAACVTDYKDVPRVGRRTTAASAAHDYPTADRCW